MSLACVVTVKGMPLRDEAIQAVRPAREAKWACRWVMPSSRAARASTMPWATSSAGNEAMAGMRAAKRVRISSSARPEVRMFHISEALRGRGTQLTGASTYAISGWKRVSVVGRSA